MHQILATLLWVLLKEVKTCLMRFLLVPAGNQSGLLLLSYNMDYTFSLGRKL